MKWNEMPYKTIKKELNETECNDRKCKQKELAKTECNYMSENVMKCEKMK